MARKIIGEHDFTSFTNTDTEVEDRVRTIYESEWHKMNDELRYRVRGNGFTYNMIRILVGTMCEIAAKGKPTDIFDDITDARDRCAAGPTAPARGLILAGIEYPSEVNPFK
jgi:tRNA pseudouridine38-40 synthase